MNTSFTCAQRSDQRVRLCGRCGNERPLSEFRRKKQGSNKRHPECDACHSEYVKRYRKLRRRRDLNEQMRRVLLTQSNPTKLEALVRAMCNRCGGLAGLVDEMTSWYREAQEKGDMASVGRFWSVMMKLIEACEQLPEQQAIETPRLSDAELSRSIIREVKKLIADRPELALMAASELDGWTVVPPPETSQSVEARSASTL